MSHLTVYINYVDINLKMNKLKWHIKDNREAMELWNSVIDELDRAVEGVNNRLKEGGY